MTNHTHHHACEHKHNHVENKVKSTDKIDFSISQPRWDSLLIQDMDCPTEERLIRDKFKGVNAIEQLEFNLIKRVLKVRHSYTSIEPLQHMIDPIGRRRTARKRDVDSFRLSA